MSLELENKVVGASIHQPALFKRFDLNIDWVYQPVNKEIIQALEDNGVEFSDLSELLKQIKQINPFTKWTEKSLEKLSYKFYDLENYETGVYLLQTYHFENRLKFANERYLNEPNKQNLLSLHDRMRELTEIKREKDNGSLDEAVEKLLYKLDNKVETGIRSYPHFDNLMGGGLRGGMLVVIGARTSVGKTAFVINMAVEMMKKQENMIVDFFTLEMSKGQMLDRFISRLANINSYNLRNPQVKLDDEQKDRVREKAIEIKRTGLKVHDSMHKLRQIEKQIRRRVHEEKDKPYIAIVDYIGLIDTENNRMQRHLQVGEITRTFKMLTNELNIPIILLSQLNRSIENRQDKTPTLADLRESGSVEQDANVVGFLHRDEEGDNITTLTIAKNREGFLNSIDYRFHGSTMYFEEVN